MALAYQSPQQYRQNKPVSGFNMGVQYGPPRPVAPRPTMGGTGGKTYNYKTGWSTPGETPKWRPDQGTVPQDIDMGGAFGGGGGSGGGGGGWQHTVMPNYLPSYNTTGGGLGFGSGLGGHQMREQYAQSMANGGPQGQNQAPFKGSDGKWYQAYGFGKREVAPPGGGGPMDGLIGSYQNARDSANKANNDRYNNILAGRTDLYDRTMAKVEGLGEQQKRDLQRQYDRNAESTKAGLVNRGMSNTTVKDTMLAGNERERAEAANRLQDALTRESVGYDQNLLESIFGFQERRTDKGPDLGQLMQIAQMMGVGGVGGGGGGGGGGAALGAIAGYAPPMAQNGFGGNPNPFQPINVGLGGWNQPQPKKPPQWWINAVNNQNQNQGGQVGVVPPGWPKPNI